MKYVALDIGNVCIRIDRQKVLDKIREEELQIFSALAQKLEFGELPEEDFLQQISSLLHNVLTPNQVREKFNSIICEPMPGMEDFVRQLQKNGIGAAFFSDISTLHLQEFRRIFPPAREMSGIYSFDVGCWKPSIRMFEAFEAGYGTPLLYADDRKELVDAALEHGWNAVVFQSAEQLSSLLFSR